MFCCIKRGRVLLILLYSTLVNAESDMMILVCCGTICQSAPTLTTYTLSNWCIFLTFDICKLMYNSDDLEVPLN